MNLYEKLPNLYEKLTEYMKSFLVISWLLPTINRNKNDMNNLERDNAIIFRRILSMHETNFKPKFLIIIDIYSREWK